MRTRFVAVALLATCAGSKPGQKAQDAAAISPTSCPVPRPPAIVIEHVTVIDVQTGERRADQSVLITGNRIAAIGSTGQLEAPKGARRVHAGGSFITPGLWDMHAHTYRSLDVVGSLYLANGVTGIRDMGSRIGEKPVLALRDSIRAGTKLGPRMVVGGGPRRLVGGVLPPPQLPGAPPAGELTEREARAAVDSLARMGVDFIKAVSLSAPAFLGAADAARANKLFIVGHLPWRLDIRAASEAGARSLEHLLGILTACSKREDELRSAIAGWMENHENFGPDAEAHFVQELVSSQDPAKCAKLYARLAQSGTFIGPTLLVMRQQGWPEEIPAPDDSRLRYVRVEEQARWRSGEINRRRLAKGMDLQSLAAQHRTLYSAYEEIIRQLARSGVPLLLGSDAGFPFIFHGASVRDEMALLVRAGLSPLQVLQMATLQPARYLGRTDELGAVAPGKLADLLILDGDPLADITNTARIRAVVADGCFLDRAALDQLLASAASIATSAP